MTGNKVKGVRLTSIEWEGVELHGGLGSIVRRFLAENIPDDIAGLSNARSRLEAQREDVETRLALSKAETKVLEDKLIKIDVEIAGVGERIKVVELKVQRKSGVLQGQESKAKELLLTEKKRKAHRVKTPKEWMRENKLYLVMQYSAYDKLTPADEARVVQKMGIPSGDVVGWLFSLTPDRIPQEVLEKARTHTFPTPPNLQLLKAQGRIREPFYALLMLWLGLQAKEAVDTWIERGFENPPIQDNGVGRAADGVK